MISTALVMILILSMVAGLSYMSISFVGAIGHISKENDKYKKKAEIAIDTPSVDVPRSSGEKVETRKKPSSIVRFIGFVLVAYVCGWIIYAWLDYNGSVGLKIVTLFPLAALVWVISSGYHDEIAEIIKPWFERENE